MKEVRGIIFDCDGVLFDSQRANLAFYNAVLAHFGETPVTSEDREKTRICHTAASSQVFEALLGAGRKEQAQEFASSLSYRQFIPHMTPEPGMVEALAVLSCELPLAVATNRGSSMSDVLDHFGLTGYFKAVVTCHNVLRPKPFPDMLFLAADLLGFAVSELLFVGDSDLDREAALSAGMPFAAYKWAAEGAMAVTRHGDLVEWIRGRSRST